MRGPLAAYNALQIKDNDTLYFITDSTNNKTLLYLGQNLISDSSDTLSSAARNFLDSLPANENQINDGDIQVYVIEEVEKEVTDPQTGETTIIVEEEGHWVTKGIDEALPLDDIATDLSPLILQRILGDDENNINDSYDTIKEISDWILNHPSDAIEINERLIALEEAIGAGQTETEIRPVVDENDNPVYQQLVDEETGKSQYLDIDPETTDAVPLSELEEGQPVYPAYEENPEGDEPPYIPITDPETGEQLYWDLNEEPTLIDDESGDITDKPPAFVQEMEEVEVSIPNDVEILKTTVGDLAELLGYSNDQNNNKILTTIDNLDTRLDTVESLINNGSNVIALNTKVGNLEDLLLRTVPTNEVQVNEPTSLVQAINVLDNRTRWQDLN